MDPLYHLVVRRKVSNTVGMRKTKSIDCYGKKGWKCFRKEDVVNFVKCSRKVQVEV